MECRLSSQLQRASRTRVLRSCERARFVRCRWPSYVACTTRCVLRRLLGCRPWPRTRDTLCTPPRSRSAPRVSLLQTLLAPRHCIRVRTQACANTRSADLGRRVTVLVGPTRSKCECARPARLTYHHLSSLGRGYFAAMLPSDRPLPRGLGTWPISPHTRREVCIVAIVRARS